MVLENDGNRGNSSLTDKAKEFPEDLEIVKSLMKQGLVVCVKINCRNLPVVLFFKVKCFLDSCISFLLTGAI